VRFGDYVNKKNKLVYQLVYQAPLSRKNDAIVPNNVTVCYHQSAFQRLLKIIYELQWAGPRKYQLSALTVFASDRRVHHRRNSEKPQF
jgi:hypothetical protein